LKISAESETEYEAAADFQRGSLDLFVHGENNLTLTGVNISEDSEVNAARSSSRRSMEDASSLKGDLSGILFSTESILKQFSGFDYELFSIFCVHIAIKLFNSL